MCSQKCARPEMFTGSDKEPKRTERKSEVGRLRHDYHDILTGEKMHMNSGAQVCSSQ